MGIRHNLFRLCRWLCLGVGLGGLVGAAPGRAEEVAADIVVYGGSSAGVIAAVQAAHLGKAVVLVNPYSFLGGMTASGLNSADVGNTRSISGLTRKFFLDMGKVYGVKFGVEFESGAAERAFNAYVAEAGVRVWPNERLDLKHGVLLDGRRIVALRMESGRRFAGRQFIDASYEGDLLAGAGVTCVVGREGNARYGETFNGFLRTPRKELKRTWDLGPADQFLKDVDPYVVRGDRASGLLPWVNRELLPNGAADARVQACNYRLIFSSEPTNQIPFEKPAGYRELDHELLLRNFEAGDTRVPGRLTPLPHHKAEWNTGGAVGTDLAGASQGYVEADYAGRAAIDRAHELYTRGHLWTLAHHPRVPAAVRAFVGRWGYAKDEFPRNGGFPYMLYLREGRRLVGDYVMTEQHFRHEQKAPDPVALASYPMDSHVVQYLVNERGVVEREGVFFKFAKGPYGVSYRAIVPRRGECPNLLTPICVSASHAVYGSIRMEPVFMALAQAAATAASLAIDRGLPVQQVPYAELRQQLVADGMKLTW